MRPLLRALALFLALPLLAQGALQPEVVERRLANGARVILAQRPGDGAFHASLFFRQGGADETGAFVGATELLARSLYGHTWPEDIDEDPALDALLKQEEGLWEDLRLQRVQARRNPDSPPAQVEELQASLDALHQQIQAKLQQDPAADLYAAQGGRNQLSVATRDFLAFGVELPRAAFPFWCRTEVARLRRAELSRMPFDRGALLAEFKRAAYPKDPGIAVLLGAALPGHPYGRDLSDHAASLEALRWSELRAFVRRTCAPSRLAIVLVGDLDPAEVMAELDQTLGRLPSQEGAEDAILPELNPELGDRRVQVLGSDPRLLVGWRIPPRAHPDYSALALLAQILGGGASGRLEARLVDRQGLLQDVDASLGRPGARFPGLFIVEAHPLEGHSVREAEAAVHSEILRLQQEPISLEEWQKAVSQLELAHLATQEDAREFALALGLAWVQTGDWRTFLDEPRRWKALGPESLQRAARTYLVPLRRTTVAVERDVSASLDPIDLQIIEVLKSLAASHLSDPAQREALVSEGLRQMQMLPPAERERTLKLLRAQMELKR
ncbi:MAG TPA: insulinase family protein [Holophagaceae bacterium]|nr:insulinase family protein [Holophagaceae bacterium]